MNSIIIEVKENHGNGTIKMKVFNSEKLTQAQLRYLSSLKRDDAIKYGTLLGCKVIDIGEWL